MIGKVLLGVLTIWLLLAVFATPIADGIHDFRVDTVSLSAPATPAGTPLAADITLSRDLFMDDTSEVSSVSSTVPATPVVTDYDPITKALTVSNLNSGAQVVTVTYSSEKEDTILQAIGPFILFLIIGGCLAAIVYSIWKGKRA